jgi:hypothetical protein
MTGQPALSETAGVLSREAELAEECAIDAVTRLGVSRSLAPLGQGKDRRLRVGRGGRRVVSGEIVFLAPHVLADNGVLALDPAAKRVSSICRREAPTVAVAALRAGIAAPVGN